MNDSVGDIGQIVIVNARGWLKNGEIHAATLRFAECPIRCAKPPDTRLLGAYTEKGASRDEDAYRSRTEWSH